MTTRTKPKAGRFYEIRKQLGDKPYELTEDIHIPPMGLNARDQWRKATYQLVVQQFVDAKSIDAGVVPEYVDYNKLIEQALLGDQYEACKELFADDARAWDMFVAEVRDFNKVADTTTEADAEGNGAATPAASQ